MPWTISNLLLHDKPVALGNQRGLGFTKVWAYCSNPDCHHNANIDVSHLPDQVTFNDLQPAWSVPSAAIAVRISGLRGMWRDYDRRPLSRGSE
jgi:hypothetical protein